MKSIRIILLLGALLLPVTAGAQTRAEKNLYTKTMKKPSVKAADKFLGKYPESVYAPQVLHMKDSLLEVDFIDKNISLISKEEALAVAGDAMDAVGWKKDGAEHVLALQGDLTLRILDTAGQEEDLRMLPVYSMEDTPQPLALVLPMEVISPLGGRRNYVHFGYSNGNTEYVEVLYMPEEDILHQAIFYGNALAADSLRIEGQCPEMMEGVVPAAEVAWLVQRFRENPSLVPISRADLLTDAAIAWWREKNPKAETSASRLSFGLLDPESSIAAACKSARKERGKGSSAALFDIRGYTVICATNYKSGECSLVWCEPVCKNRKTDKYLSTIYFENDGTTLDLIYYKGKTTFKKKISLVSKTIHHFQ